MHSLADTFLLNNRVNLMLLAAMTEEQLAYVGSPRARSVADQFAHMHNVRLMWLEVSAPPALKGLAKIEKGAATKAGLRAALEASAEALAATIGEADRAGKMRAYKRGPVAFCGYALAHEANHRGQIILHLKYGKMPVDKSVAYGIWEWDKI
jgi:uncharacterized damage-inducible protein DinB